MKEKTMSKPIYQRIKQAQEDHSIRTISIILFTKDDTKIKKSIAHNKLRKFFEKHDLPEPYDWRNRLLRSKLIFNYTNNHPVFKWIEMSIYE